MAAPGGTPYTIKHPFIVRLINMKSRSIVMIFLKKWRLKNGN